MDKTRTYRSFSLNMNESKQLQHFGYDYNLNVILIQEASDSKHYMLNYTYKHNIINAQGLWTACLLRNYVI